MGIYDRDYYREEPSGRRRFGIGLRVSGLSVLLALNVGVFLLWHFAGPAGSWTMSRHFTMSWEGLSQDYRLHTLITAAFSHYNIWHLLFNLLFLYVFGREVEAVYGRLNLVWLYVFAALAAAGLHLAVSAARGVDRPALGASGAAMGIALACAGLYPDRIFYVWGIAPIKLKWLALIFIVLDLLALAEHREDLVAHGAHLGGALAGYLFYRLDLRLCGREGSGLPGRLAGLLRRRPKLRLVQPRRRPEADEPPPDAETPTVDARTTARVDELLEKIHKQGMGALSDEEREFLGEASRKYRR
jgi:membrane associated rhomboid family serine protease